MSTNHLPQTHAPSTADRQADDLNPTCGVAALATDSALIPGIYQTCDQWCLYCRATNRCLAFRSTNASDVNGVWDPVDADEECLANGMRLMTSLADVEGQSLPPEIEAILSGDRERQRSVFTLDDPLERLGRSCMTLAEAYLKSRSDFPPDIVWRPEGPTPLEVLTWYHVLAPARVFRAILCAEEAAQGVAGRHDDASCAARVALVGIDRSLTALSAIAIDDDDPRVELLQNRLQRLRDAIDRRFPDACGFIRPGLDDETLERGRAAAAGTPSHGETWRSRVLARWIRRLAAVRARLSQSARQPWLR